MSNLMDAESQPRRLPDRQCDLQPRPMASASRKYVMLASLACAAGTAQAGPGMFYIGGGITNNNVNSVPVLGELGTPKISSGSWKLFAGVRPIHAFAGEVDYFDLGSASTSRLTPMECVDIGSCGLSTHADAQAFAAYGVGFLPVPVPALDVYGKLGLASYKLNGNVTYTLINGTQTYATGGTSTVLAWGAGAQVHFGKFGGRLEYEGLDKASTNVLSLSVFLTLP